MVSRRYQCDDTESLNWILKNMIYTGPETNLPEIRQLGDAELRVRACLKRMCIPEWYANKIRPSPKIIMDRRPIESRPAPWKDVAKRQALLTESLEAAAKSSDQERKTEREIDSFEIQKLATKNLLDPSKTFPKVSPSRKIQNINIVFPRAEEGSKPYESTESSNFSEAKKSFESSAVEKSAKPTKNHPRILQETSFPVGSDESNDTLENFTPERMSGLNNQTKSATSSTPLRSDNSTASPRARKWSVRRDNLFVDSRKSVDCRRIGTVDTTDRGNSSIDGEENLFVSPNKSTEMQNLIKCAQVKCRSPRKSLIEEKIRSLEAKTASRVRSTSPIKVSPKSSVKSIVRALEIGAKSDEKSASISCKDDASDVSESSSDSPFQNFRDELENRDDISVESVTPYADDRDENVFWIPMPIRRMPRTSSLKSMMSRLSARQELNPRNIFGDTYVSSVKSADSSSWISSGSESPTSTLTSRRSASPVGFVPPCRTARSSGFKASFDWGKTYNNESNGSLRKMLRIDETVVLDSGYSDRSGTNSPSTSDDFCDEEEDIARTFREISNGFVESCLRGVESCGISMRGHHAYVA